MPAGGQIGIETEIAFRLGRGFPKRATPYTLAEIQDGIAAAFPAVEMVAAATSTPPR